MTSTAEPIPGRQVLDLSFLLAGLVMITAALVSCAGDHHS